MPASDKNRPVRAVLALSRVAHFLDDPRVETAAKRIFTGLAIVGVAVSLLALRLSIQTSAHEREGRQIVREVICGITKGIISSGRQSIESGGKKYAEPYESNLRRLNLIPPLAARMAASEIAAQAYSQAIASATQQVTGRNDLVQPNGTLNCDKLNQVATP